MMKENQVSVLRCGCEYSIIYENSQFVIHVKGCGEHKWVLKNHTIVNADIIKQAIK